MSHNNTESKSEDIPTYSLCVADTCISPRNCKNLTQVVYTAYQIAETACAFDIREVVVLPTVLKDEEIDGIKEYFQNTRIDIEDEDDLKERYEQEKIKYHDEAFKRAMLLASLLLFFVTPPYLVKTVFQNVQINPKAFILASKLPKITTLPFMRINKGKSSKQFREGMSISKTKQKRQKTSSGKVKKIKKADRETKFVNIGESQLFELKDAIPTNARVTVDVKNHTVISPMDAYGSMGMNNSYGYEVRFAPTWKDCIDNHYDSTITACCGEYYPSSSDKNHLVDLIDTDELHGRVLVIVSRWSDIFNTVKEEDRESESPVSGRIEIPSQVRVEIGCTIALTRLLK